MRTNFLLGIGLFLTTLTAAAQTPPNIDGWTMVASNDTQYTYLKTDSYKLINGIRSIVIQQIPTSSNSDTKVYYMKLAISDVDCKNGYGTIKLYTPSGNFIADADYVKGGSSVGATVMDIICMVNS